MLNTQGTLTVLFSPLGRTGQTTMANLVGAEFGKDSDSPTLLIELSAGTGMSLYINKRVGERRKSLSNVLLEEKLLRSHVHVSYLQPNFYYTCFNLEDTGMKLNVEEKKLVNIIEEARKDFKHVILDLAPGLYVGKQHNIILDTVISPNFKPHIDNFIVSIDPSALSFTRLSDMDKYLASANSLIKEVTLVSNKAEGDYLDFISNKLAFDYLKIKNLIRLDHVKGMNKATNEGSIYRLPKSRERDEYFRGIGQLKRIIEDCKIGGIGIDKNIVEENRAIIARDYFERKAQNQMEIKDAYIGHIFTELAEKQPKTKKTIWERIGLKKLTDKATLNEVINDTEINDDLSDFVAASTDIEDETEEITIESVDDITIEDL